MVGDGKEGAWLGSTLQLDSGGGRTLGQISSFSSSWFEIGLRSGGDLSLLAGDFDFTIFGRSVGWILRRLVKVLRVEIDVLG